MVGTAIITAGLRFQNGNGTDRTGRLPLPVPSLAPPHFPKEVRTWLNEKFNGRWIGRGGPISWAPHSPDLTPLDFFVCGDT